MVPEAKLEQTEAGLVPATTGWFVMSARDARWRDQPGRGHSLPLTGADEYEAETFFPMLGMAIRVVNPGEPTGTYHWETERCHGVVTGTFSGRNERGSDYPAVPMRRSARRPRSQRAGRA
jgi:hypothetical protein